MKSAKKSFLNEEELLEIFKRVNFKEEMAGGQLVEGSDVGPVYHIAFFRKGEDDKPIFDDHFEAIIGDPHTYIKNLNGLYGCMVKKTDKSPKWFEDYLYNAVGRVMIDKMKGALTAIAVNTK
jgi:hypothetical protein